MAQPPGREDISPLNEIPTSSGSKHGRAYSKAKSLFRGSAGSSSSINLSPNPLSPSHNTLSPPQLPPLSHTTSGNSDLFSPHHASYAGQSSAAVNLYDADTVDDAVGFLNIMQLVRQGRKPAIDAFLNSNDPEISLSQKQALLHVAVMCGSPQIVQYILSFYTRDRPWLDINSRDSDGNTALHVATKSRRLPIVSLLLQRPDINDTIVNNDSEAPIDLDTSDEIKDRLSNFRLAFERSTVSRIRSLVAKRDYDQLKATLADPRVQVSLNLANPELVTDQETIATAGTLLHEAARKGDEHLVQILLDAGADPFVRDRRGKGKRPSELNKNDAIRALFKQAKARDSHSNNLLMGETPLENKESREMRGYLRKWTNYRSGYRPRWFVLENGVLSYYKNEKDAGTACRGAINMRIATLTADPQDKFRFEINGPERSSVKYHLKANSENEAKRWIWVLNAAIRWAKDQEVEQRRQADRVDAAVHSDRNHTSTHEGSISAHSGQSRKSSNLDLDNADVIGAEASRVVSRNTANLTCEEGSDVEDDVSSNHDQATLQDSFTRNLQSSRMELLLLSSLLKTLQNSSSDNSNPEFAKAMSASEASVASLRDMIDSLEGIYADNDQAWKSELQVWEDAITRYDREQEELQAKMGVSEDKRKRQKRLLKVIRNSSGSGLFSTPQQSQTKLPSESLGQKSGDTAAVKGDEHRTQPPPPIHQATLIDPDLLDSDSDDEDEFFDAINEITTETAELALEEPTAEVEPQVSPDSQIAPSFKGYEDPVRTHLKLSKDNRPKISLWGILKSMIGKDMTKMTLPVSFNEPTSLLHRVAEDMEYSDLLDKAVDMDSSTERLLFVAAFAASEYASTIGRIAKPFNPLLAETFEYVRPDKGYRFFVEQVSHHPPISAAYAESERWEYWGESAVKSNFYGKSFDINPLGTWFLRLKPKDGPAELYTWKKVTSSVVGIIMGSPTVENYGLMTIQNHTLGDVAEVEFKRRGWGSGSSPYRVSGRVFDSRRNPAWEISGAWNNRIFYKSPTDSDVSEGKLIWQAHARPQDMPFNLTSFAVTFNALPDKLVPYLAPTDSRFRPDQRAMEEGEYDLAATEKERLEDAQRARRAERERKQAVFTPRWFYKTKCDVTGESYWQFNGDYWKIRDQVGRGEMSWDEVELEDIYPPRLKKEATAAM